MSLEDKFAQFNLSEQAIKNFKFIADLHAKKNSRDVPFFIETKIIGVPKNQVKEASK